MCPNMGECWSHGVATFMILGEVCTRGCRYCAVTKGKPSGLDLEEPRRVAEAVATMQLSHVVLTSVNRDDLQDGGAGIFAETIGQIRRLNPGCSVEVLVPDFQGSEEALQIVISAMPEIFGHNVETVPRLYKAARGGGKYDVSLQVLSSVKELQPELTTKSGLMLGLGEDSDEIRQVMQDLVNRRLNILTLGQYLRPTRWHLPVARHYLPKEFVYWKKVAEDMGFDHVESGPLVRSSYMADRQFKTLMQKGSSRADDIGLVQLS
jgi:lipoic acid synthetase